MKGEFLCNFQMNYKTKDYIKYFLQIGSQVRGAGAPDDLTKEEVKDNG